MTAQSDRQKRDQLLDDLKSAVDDWSQSEQDKINKEVTFVKSVLRGRTGSERLQRSKTTEARVLVIDDINSFLSGEGA